MSVFFINFIVPPQSEERPDDLVDASYVARRFGCSERSVYAGACGTGEIVPVTRSPWRAVRQQVEEIHRRLIDSAAQKTPAQKAMRLLNRKGRGRKAA